MLTLSISHTKAIAIIPMITGALSILGSGAIIYKILLDRKKKITKVYHRLMLAMSCLDIIMSMSAALSTIPIPKDIPSVWGNIGNETTCNIQGFTSVFGFGVIFYNTSLSIYFLLCIRYGMTESKIGKTVEPAMHIISILYPLSCAIAGLYLKVYNFSETRCWVSPYPQDCINNDQIDCDWGEFAYSFRWLYAGGSLIIFWCVILTSQFLIFWTFWCQDKAMNKKYGTYSIVPRCEKKRVSLPVSSNGPNPQLNNLRKRTLAVATQASFFVLASTMTYIWPLLYRGIEQTSSSKPSLFLLYVKQVFFPLQGLFNFLVYVRPSYIKIRAQNMTKSRTWALRHALLPQSPRNLATKPGLRRRRSSVYDRGCIE